MANKVTGSTDTTGAMSTVASSVKSVLLVGKVTGTPTKVTTENTLFSITGTTDATERFGTGSVMISAVKALVQNGVDNMYGIIVSGTGTDTGFNNYDTALNASLNERSIKCIVMDDYSAEVMAKLKTHLAIAEQEDMFRYAVAPVATDDNDTMVTYAETFGDSRIFVVGPTLSEGGVATPRTVVAAGVSGAIMTETDDPALPMNGVTIKGIGNINVNVLESTKSLLVSNGVTPLYNESGLPAIHRLVTSYTTDAIWQEGTTRFIADYVLENIETVLRANYKRTKNVTRILDSIKTTVKGLLENFQSLEIIENFDPSTLTVVKDPTDMYGALVDYEFDVVTPLYTITINQHMVL